MLKSEWMNNEKHWQVERFKISLKIRCGKADNNLLEKSFACKILLTKI